MHLTAAKRLLWYLKGIATISLNDGQADTLVEKETLITQGTSRRVGPRRDFSSP